MSIRASLPGVAAIGSLCGAMSSDIDSPKEFEKLSAHEQKTVLKWIRTHITPRARMNKSRTSYGIKHSFEDDKVHGGFYMTNGAFKGAMLQAGYELDNEEDQNWCFAISKKSKFITGGA